RAEAGGAPAVARRLALEHLARQPRRERTVLGGGRADDALQLAHEAAHRVRRAVGEVVRERRIRAGAVLAQHPLEHGPLHLTVGLLELRHQPAGEPRRDALFQAGERVRLSRRREDELPLLVLEQVEQVEQLLLRALLARDEMDVVEQQRGRTAVARATGPGAARRRRAPWPPPPPPPSAAPGRETRSALRPGGRAPPLRPRAP